MQLNIGGQQARDRFPAGWTCVDILPGADVHCDISVDPLPFEDSTAHVIYCSHVLEHIWPWRLKFVLDEFYRVLVPDGKLRVVVPDMDIAIDRYLEHREDPRALKNCMWWWFDPTLDGEGNLYLNHVHGFNRPSLTAWLVQSGFHGVDILKYRECYPVFTGCDNPMHEGTSIYVEVRK